MPIWLIQIIIIVLQKTGFVNWAKAMAIKAGFAVVESVENMTTEEKFPTGKNGESAEQPQSIQSWKDKGKQKT